MDDDATLPRGTSRMSEAKATSVRQRLLNLARQRGDDYNQILTRYVGLRFLHRLAHSDHAEQFTLKGATMFLVWHGSMHRPTRDLDLLGATSYDEQQIEHIVRDICLTDCADDGLTFLPETVQAEPIREDNHYGGIRCTLTASLGSARQKLQIDIGFGDAVTPGPSQVEIPRLLDDETPARIRAYTVETLVAEKLEAMVVLGIGNSRMKDFFDVVTIARTTEVDGQAMVDALRATFRRRRTELPIGVPTALTEVFWNDPLAQNRWQAFRKRLANADNDSLQDTCLQIYQLLGEPLRHARDSSAFPKKWYSSAWHLNAH